MKKTLTILSLASFIGLTACSHENPMKTQSPDATVKFLSAASLYASDKMDIKRSRKEKELWYDKCVYNMMMSNDFCPKFYDYMIEYAEKYDKKFSDITEEDLKNKEEYKKIEMKYSLSVTNENARLNK